MLKGIKHWLGVKLWVLFLDLPLTYDLEQAPSPLWAAGKLLMTLEIPPASDIPKLAALGFSANGD